MTEQIPDSCTFDGRRWRIDEWDGTDDCIPSNGQLGLNTTRPNTANLRGRINHFLIHRDTLHLFKIEANLPLADKPKTPAGARREVIKRYVPFELHDAHGIHDEARIERYDYFIFDKLVIPFSGKLFLSYPYFDFWEIPWPIEDDDEAILENVTLLFEDGRLLTCSPRD